MSDEVNSTTPPAGDEQPAQEHADRTLAQQIAENETEMFQQSQQHMQQIEDEVRQTQELCANKETIDKLVASYDPESAPKYFKKALELSQKYKAIRRIRGDGNCFYRSYLTALMEQCFTDRQLLERISKTVTDWRQRMLKFGFPELTTGDFCDAMETLVKSMQNNTTSVDFLIDDLRNENMANYYVAYMRLITSAYLRENEDLYSGFIEGLRTLDQYCKDEIEPMWKDCDHMAILGLVNAMDVPIRIEYMDQTDAPHGGHSYVVPEDREPILNFLYRPGHYDILYKE